MKAIIILSIYLIPSSGIISQTKVPNLKEDYFSEGEFFYDLSDYEEALFYYLELLKLEPENINFNYKVGMSYINIWGKEILAIPYLEKATTNVVEEKKYRKSSIEESQAPHNSYFYLAKAYRIANQLTKALKTYDVFINSPNYFDNYNDLIVEKTIKSCERAKIIQDNPVIYTEINLPVEVNSNFYEINPVISENESNLIFIRKLKFYDAIFYTTKVNGKWLEPVNITPQIGSDEEFYPTSLSSDGRDLYMVRKLEENNDIFVSHFSDTCWSKAEMLDKRINSVSNENYASISNDNQILYFTSDRAGLKEGFDIYCSVKDSKGKWGKAKSIGKTINSYFDEESPCIVNNGKTLFFSSNGHYGMGGFDIFYSNKDGDEWSTPINLGFPINNSSDNFFYYPLNSANEAYYSKSDSVITTNTNIVKIKVESPMDIKKQ